MTLGTCFGVGYFCLFFCDEKENRLQCMVFLLDFVKNQVLLLDEDPEWQKKETNPTDR